jgi:hypothetical protein
LQYWWSNHTYFSYGCEKQSMFRPNFGIKNTEYCSRTVHIRPTFKLHQSHFSNRSRHTVYKRISKIVGYLGVYLPTLIQPLDRAIPTVDRISIVNCTNGPVDAPYFSSPPDKNPPPVAKHQKEITSSRGPFHHWNSHLDLAKGSIFLSSLHRPA